MTTKKINKKDIHNLIRECIHNYLKESSTLLTEDKEGRNMKKARNVVRELNPNLDAMKVITDIRNDIPNSRINQCEYLPGITRMVLSGELNDGAKINKINDSLLILGRAHANEYNNDLNGLSADEIINKFDSEVLSNLQADKEAHNKETFTPNNEYSIVRIESTQQAWPYSKYTDWCITSPELNPEYEDDDIYEDEDGDDYGYDEREFNPENHPEATEGYEMYSSYTHGGLGVFYFILRKGFENVPKEKGEGCPLDDYGLSMIATSVDERGKCNTITCRWNHENGGNDKIMTPMQLSKLIGRNYYEVFKPYTKDELHAKGLITFDEVIELLASGTPYQKIFKEYTKLSNGLIRVKLNDAFNFINPNTNQLISKDWFQSASDFMDGFCAVSLRYGCSNYVKEDGTYLFPQWIKGTTYTFKNGYGLINNFENNKGYYLIDKTGQVINSTPFPERGTVIGNFYEIKYYDEYTLYKLDGEPILNRQKFTNIEDEKNGCLKVTVKGDLKEDSGWYGKEYNYSYGLIYPNGNLFLNKLFNSLYVISQDNVLVRDENNKEGLFKLNGEQIGTWFDSVDTLGIYPLVKLNDKCNYIDLNSGNFMLKKWAEDGSNVQEDGVIVKYNNLWFLLGSNLQPIINEGFNYATSYAYNARMYKVTYPVLVQKGDKYNFVDKDGNMCNTWFDTLKAINKQSDGRFMVNIGNQKYQIKLPNLAILPYTREDQIRDREEDEYWDNIRRECQRD